MVLQHIPQGASAIVKADAPLKAHRFGHGDLHMIDMRGVPQGLEHNIGKAKRQQVLHRLLAEIVIDAEDAIFGEGARNGVVDMAAGGKICAQRLFKADARRGPGEAARHQPGDGRLEQAGRGGEKNRQPLFGGANLLRQRAKIPGVGGVERLEMEALEKGIDSAAPLGRHKLFQRRAGEGAIGRIVEIGAGGADDLKPRGKQPIGMQRTQRGQQHTLGKIAGGPEE